MNFFKNFEMEIICIGKILHGMIMFIKNNLSYNVLWMMKVAERFCWNFSLQVTSGVRYHVMVELVETICPKYKRRINKARCAPDIGEDHMVSFYTVSNLFVDYHHQEAKEY